MQAACYDSMVVISRRSSYKIAVLHLLIVAGYSARGGLGERQRVRNSNDKMALLVRVSVAYRYL